MVKQYLAYFKAMVAQKNMPAILQLYELESVMKAVIVWETGLGDRRNTGVGEE